MIKDQDYYAALFKRYLNDDCQPEEAKEILAYIQSSSSNRFLLDQLKISFDNEALQKDIYGQSAEFSSTLRQTISGKTQPVAKVVALYKKWLPKVAAAAILFTSLATMFIITRRPSTPVAVLTSKNTKAVVAKNEILPGNNKALLTLSDGSVVALDDTKNGIVARQGKTNVAKNNNQVIYNAPDVTGAAPVEITFNTIATPNGGQYQVVLPDGSKVWLNAASSLRFPTSFSGAERKVELTGEGYFEVAKDAAHPFHVQVSNTEITVLGTHFNVMGYNNEAALKTTLLEGAVKISYGNMAKILKPGQQAKVENSNDGIEVINADTEQAVAWKNGSFLFVNEEIKSIMRQLSRWYDIDVSYEGKEKQRYFSGEVSRSVTLAQALKILDFSNIKFRINDKKIAVIY